MRADTLEDFIGYALEACERLSSDEDLSTIFMTDDDEPELSCLLVNEGEGVGANVDQFFAGNHTCAGMATKVAWSPSEDADFGPAWMLVVVQRGRTAGFLVGRIDLQEWWQLMPENAPWFALSTASSLRCVLDGEPMPPIKAARDGDPRLFGLVTDGTPPVDEHGRL
jgi:hypothetical protein